MFRSSSEYPALFGSRVMLKGKILNSVKIALWALYANDQFSAKIVILSKKTRFPKGEEKKVRP